MTGTKGMVATESPAAGRVGRDVLDSGGNAVDAAVATVFALNVARPQGCGIGGGGFMVYRSAAGRTAALDFRETAPARFTPKVFKRPGLAADYTGHLTVGVPGTLAGMRTALARYGTRSLSQSIAPAEQMAARGVKVTPRALQVHGRERQAAAQVPHGRQAVPSPRARLQGRAPRCASRCWPARWPPSAARARAPSTAA